MTQPFTDPASVADPLMNVGPSQDAAVLEKMRRQFDAAPYPHIPLDESPLEDLNWLYLHSVVTPYYLRYGQVVNPDGMMILDAGCGSGFTSLTLALANPGAMVVGVDLSPASIDLATQRLRYHGITTAQFHAVSIEELPSLGMQFDYINADEVLYLLPDPLAGLRAMQSVLKPNGIIRANLHSARQRVFVFQFQEFFRSLGLMDGAITEAELAHALDVMAAINDNVFLKAHAWGKDYEAEPDLLRPNCLLQGDKGFTIRDTFKLLRDADLDFIRMVYWHRWNLMSLFKDPTALPQALSHLPTASAEEQLHIFELLQPRNRLIDFWCGHPQSLDPGYVSPASWTDADWQRAIVHLHPQLATPAIQAQVAELVTHRNSVEFTQFLAIPAGEPVRVDSDTAACLLPLWDSPQPIAALVERWCKLCPLDPITLEATTEPVAYQAVKTALVRLEAHTYVMITR
ncbi:MAG: methyltransferase domain-containing protein [Cyanobacteria bacterium]|nr:methyltransferase domain-containing protein [Cyanobacteriota bacterium]MDW8200968.1 methyltransferase domain-containing protein [Cyanobacteriota bacterium SKYGB_h_bin112]